MFPTHGAKKLKYLHVGNIFRSITELVRDDIKVTS